MKNSNIYLITAHHFINAANESLTLNIGRLTDETGEPVRSALAIRYCLTGRHIPMPVRSGTWFESVSFPVMKKWLKDNGWQMISEYSFITQKFYTFQKAESTDIDDYMF